MNLEWTALAQDDLLAIADYIFRDNPAAAISVARRVRDAVSRLAEFPHLGRPGRVRGTRELVLAGTPYIVVYRVGRGSVQILRVLHGARRWP